MFKEVASQLKKPLEEGRFCKGHLMPVTCTDISGDEKYIVSGGKDCKACLWDVETGNVITIFEGKRERLDSPKRKELNCHRGEVLAVQMSYDGKYVVTAGSEGLIRIWDSRVGMAIGEESAVSVVSNVSSASGRHLQHISDCKEILRGHRGMITSLLLQRDNILYSGGLDNTIKLWNIIDTTYVDTLYGHETLITSLSGSRSALGSRAATRILSSSTDNTLRQWKIEANTQMVYRGRRGDLSMECCAMVSPTAFLAGDMAGSLALFAADKKKPVFTLPQAHGCEEGAGKWLVSVAALPFTNLAASGAFADALRLWDVNVGNRDRDGQLLRPVAAVPIVRVGGEGEL
ncbi:hypothetical protein WA538_005969 [Blastocystis sp. DL]